MKLIDDIFSSEVRIRTEKILREMDKEKVDAVLIGANPNIYYTSGRFFRGYVFISSQKNARFFVIKPNVFEDSPNVSYIRKPEDIPAILNSEGYPFPNKIGLEVDDLSYSTVVRLKALFPDAELSNGSNILKRARMVKTDWEINEMRIDGIHHSNVYRKVSKCYKPGMTDLALQIEIEKELRLEGALGISRVSGNLMEINLGSVITGDNADNPAPYEFTMGGAGMHPSLPVGSDNTTIVPGKTIMIDMNGTFNGYQTDMTRVWSLGDIPSDALRAHECSIKILRELEHFAVPGVPVKDLYEVAMKIAEEDGLADFFMGHRNRVSFIGHGVGIQLNELPVVNARSKDVLEKNMTLALEPKFVIPGVGAVGVENTYRVDDNGLVNLTIFPENIQNL